jgi:hypothetical protein
MKLQLRKPSWTEKRDSIRIELECPVTYCCVKSTLGFITKKSKMQRGLMFKPSLRGLRLLTTSAIPAGSLVHIQVDMTKLGYDRSFEIHGKTVWSEYSGKTKGFEQGVHLQNSGPDSKRWEKYILGCLQGTDRNWRQ